MTPSSLITRIDSIPKDQLRGQAVLVRIDAQNEAKLRDALPTLFVLLNSGARIVIATHSPVHNASAKLADVLGRPIRKLHDWKDEAGLRAVAQMFDGEIVMIKDLALEPGETTDDDELADALSNLCNIYCNEAFALSHELRASTVGVARKAGLAAAGLAFHHDLRALERVLQEPRQFVLALLGGALSEETLLLAEGVAKTSDRVLIGGQLCLPFLRLRGIAFSGPVVTGELIRIAERMVTDASNDKRFVLTPFDFTAVDRPTFEKLARGEPFPLGPPTLNVQEDHIRPEHVICDIGTVTQWNWNEYFGAARQVFWHGPLGVSEIDSFCTGTRFLAEKLALRSAGHFNRVVICGGSLLRVLRSIEFPKDRVHHFTPAGRTALHFFAGHPLPAVDSLGTAHRAKPKPCRVLIPLNGLDTDFDALDAVRTLPRDAQLSLLHVHPGLDEEQYPDVIDALSEAERLARRVETESIFARANAILATFGFTSAHQMSAQGKPSDVISRYAARMEAEMIVLSGGRESIAIRNIVEHTAHAALLARPHVHGERRKRIVLVAVDGSASALEATGRIGQLIEAERTEIVLLYVQKPDERGREIERRLEAERIFRTANDVLALQGLVSLRQVAVDGDPAKEIVSTADEMDVDLIVIGSDSTSAIRNLVLGSVSRKVTDHAKQSVLVVRSQHEAMLSQEAA
jgi:phosphoglycerate kinase